MISGGFVFNNVEYCFFTLLYVVSVSNNYKKNIILDNKSERFVFLYILCIVFFVHLHVMISPCLCLSCYCSCPTC